VSSTLTLQSGVYVLTLADQSERRFDANGRLISVRDPQGRSITLTYDARSQVVRSVRSGMLEDAYASALNVTTATDYDALGRVSRQIDNYVEGVFTATEPITDRITLFQYDTLSRVITTTANLDASGTPSPATNRTTVQAYDPSTGRLLGKRDALGSWDHVDYDALGQVTQTVQNCRTAAGVAMASGCAPFSANTPDHNLVAASYGYDVLGRLRIQTDAAGLVSETRYDGLGRSTAQVLNPQAGQPSTALVNVVTQTRVNALGQATHITDPLSNVAQRGYDGLGRTTVLTDALGHATRMGYDPDGVLLA
jgi:YD repeat-containing protein